MNIYFLKNMSNTSPEPGSCGVYTYLYSRDDHQFPREWSSISSRNTSIYILSVGPWWSSISSRNTSPPASLEPGGCLNRRFPRGIRVPPHPSEPPWSLLADWIVIRVLQDPPEPLWSLVAAWIVDFLEKYESSCHILKYSKKICSISDVYTCFLCFLRNMSFHV